MQRLSVAVVGGGVAGASCAWRLAQAGHSVELFDLGKKFLGGRSSTRRVLGTAQGGDGMHVDHGAQFLTAASPKTQPLIDELRAAGKLAAWEPRLAEVNSSTGSISLKEAGQLSGGFFGALSSGPMYVGQPSMDAICTHLTSHPGIKLQLGTRVSAVALDSGRWQLHGHPGAGKIEVALGQFDALVCTDIQCGRTGSPSFVAARGADAQAALREFQAAAAAAGLRRTPLFAMLLGYDTRAGTGAAAPELPFDAATFSAGSSFAWLANDSSKPGRPTDGLQCWVAVSSEAFGAELLGAELDSATLPPQDAAYLAERQDRMLAAARKDLQAAGLGLPQPSRVQVHRWGSAYVASPLGVPCIVHPGARFVAAGDFCLGAGVESAMLSGLAAADAVDAAASAKGS